MAFSDELRRLALLETNGLIEEWHGAAEGTHQRPARPARGRFLQRVAPCRYP
jgi:hypothetical protein